MSTSMSLPVFARIAIEFSFERQCSIRKIDDDGYRAIQNLLPLQLGLSNASASPLPGVLIKPANTRVHDGCEVQPRPTARQLIDDAIRRFLIGIGVQRLTLLGKI